MSRRPPIRYIWKILFAAVAISDISCTVFLMQKEDSGVKSQIQDDICPIPSNDTQTNVTSLTFIYEVWNWRAERNPKVRWIGLIFCALCLVEAFLRSCDARRMALHNKALDELEQTMLKFAHRSSKTLSRIFGGIDIDDVKHSDKKLSYIDRWMKFNRSCWTWIPALATFSFWLFILPTEIEDFHQACGGTKLRDSAVITKWLILLSHSMTLLFLSFRESVDSIIWTKVMPYRIHKQPQRFLKRLRVVLQGIRFVRFAGPLARMVSTHHLDS